MASHENRFTDVAWQDHPYFRMISDSYLAFEQWMNQLCDSAGSSWQSQMRARFLTNILTAAVSPANFLATNPVALKRLAETDGRSLLDGYGNMLRDLARGGMPSAADRRPFPVGEKIACTPGAVVYREELFELLQYAPATPRVRACPLLMVPPQVNRHYILDLAPGRSVAEFAVSLGVPAFMIVWRNPRANLGHGRWGVEDYLAAEQRAAEVVKKISRSETISWLGLCAGGMTTAWTLGRLAAAGDTSASSATFIVSMVASTYPNVVGMLDTSENRRWLELAAEAEQVIPGTALRTLFALLRPNDLVFNYLVSGWLMGKPPAAFDVLAWNDDATATTARFALESTRIAVDGPADLSGVTCDSFHVGGFTDHITPWRTAYDTCQALGGAREMTVVRSGHVQSFVNPADSTRYDGWYGPPSAASPDEWLAAAAVEHGSWWRRWGEWLAARSGSEKPARNTLGSREYPPLAPAPGTYVHE
jgi:polyhydroxyalkanoate synthase